MNDLVNRLRSQGDNEAADEIERLTSERDAALAGAMRVRKLVWTGGWHGRRSGVYTILPNYGKGPKRFMLSHGSNIIGWFDGEEEAKAFAQADHEARTRAAIEPDAPSVSAAAKVLLVALEAPPTSSNDLEPWQRANEALGTGEESWPRFRSAIRALGETK